MDEKTKDKCVEISFWVVMILALIATSAMAGGASYATYPCENNSICQQADLFKSNGNPYASVILNNQVESLGGTMRLKDCDLFDCRDLLQITPAVKININNDNKVAGWFAYNHSIVEYKGAVIWDGSAWLPLDTSGTKDLEAGATYFFGLDYHKSKPSDAVDLIPEIFGVSIDRWAWWNDTFRYKIGFNISNTGSNLTDYEMLFALDLNESITNGSNLRATWVNGTTEQAIGFWRSDGNYNGDTAWDSATAAGSVWAKVPSIPSGAFTSVVYFYYSDFTGLPDTSNATNTFMAYHDCNSTTGWTVLSGILTSSGVGGSCHLSGFNATVPVAQANLTAFTLPNTSIVEWSMGFSPASNQSDIHTFLVNGDGGKFHTAGGTGYSGYSVRQQDSSGAVSGLFEEALNLQTGIITMATNASSIKYRLTTNATNMTLMMDNVAKGTTNDSTYAHGGNIAMAEFQQTTFTNSSGSYDDIRIRTQADIEPTAAPIPEEDSGNYTVFASSSACGSYMQIANFTILDESTSAVAIANATFNITSSTAGITNSSFSGISPFYLCKANSSPAFNITVVIQYWNTTAGVRNYYMTADNTTNTTITLFLAPSSLTSAIQFITKDQFGTALSNRIQHYLRYFPANNSYVLVAMGETDANGAVVANIFTNGTTFYNIISFSPNGGTTIEKTWNAEPVYCISGQSCSHDLTLNSNVSLPEYWTDVYNLVAYNCSYTNGTKTVACTYADSSGTSHTYNLTTRRLGWGNPVQVCTTTSTAASGTLLCTINDTNLTGSIYSWEFRHHTDPLLLSSGMLDFRNISFKYVATGLAMLIILAFGLIGLFNPAIGFILVPIGIAVASWFQFIDIPVGVIAGLVLMGAILARKAGGG
jgi:hypothetical protein